MGLPGSGKTTLATLLAKKLNAVHFNADQVRTNINKDLGFTHEDRIEQARRMGWLCDQVIKAGHFAIADFICPTDDTREAFGDAFIIWVDRIKTSRYPDTDALFEPPHNKGFELKHDVRIDAVGTPEHWADYIFTCLTISPISPTALIIGRYQPFHEGHKALVVEAIRRVGQVCIGVRDTYGIDDKNPLSFDEVQRRIKDALFEYDGMFTIMGLPNITNVFYGRDVGYSVEEIVLPQDIQAISATKIRELEGLS